ncbi:hypothetical protein EVG20_g7545, partial [Dentipellis fragilis]
QADSPATVEQTEEKEEGLGGVAWSKRLEEMEKRQTRIEALLEEIARGMRK